MLKNVSVARSCGVLVLCSASSALASPISDYNMILLGDLKANSLHVYKSSFVGGNIDTKGWLEFGSRLDKNTSNSTLEVAGNIYGAGVTIQAGYLSYAGSSQLQGLNCNGQDLSNGRCVGQNQQLANKTAILAQQLYQDSAYLASLQANGLVDTKDHNRKSFSYQNTDDIAVFTIDAVDLFSQNSNWSLFSGLAETVVINVSGIDIKNSGGVNFNNGWAANQSNGNIGASNIVWNFYQATSINLGSTRFNGSILAPYADLTSWNDIDGSVAAKSYSGAGQIHDKLFNWRLPQYGQLPNNQLPSASIPAPASLLLMLSGLFAVLLFRRRRATTGAN